MRLFVASCLFLDIKAYKGITTLRFVVIKLDKLDCEWSNFSVAKELAEQVVDHYQTYPADYLGEKPEGWFTSKKPHKLYGIKFSREDIRELAREMCKADHNVPIDDVFTDWDELLKKHWDKAHKILVRLIDAKDQKN